MGGLGGGGVGVERGEDMGRLVSVGVDEESGVAVVELNEVADVASSELVLEQDHLAKTLCRRWSGTGMTKHKDHHTPRPHQLGETTPVSLDL